MNLSGAASTDLKIQIVLLVLCLAGWALALLYLQTGRRKAAHAALRDEHLNVPNKTAWTPELEREIARAGREGTPLCVALIELPTYADYARENEKAKAKRLMREATDEWRRALRMTDVLARLDEATFGVLLPGCAPALSRDVVARLLEDVPDDFHVAAGVVTSKRGEGRGALMTRAERALNTAKRGGHGTVIADGPQPAFGGSPEVNEQQLRLPA